MPPRGGGRSHPAGSRPATLSIRAGIRPILWATAYRHSPKPPSVDRVDPSLGGLRLHLFERIVALGLDDQVQAVREPDDEVRDLVVWFPVAEIRDLEAEALVLDECFDGRVRVEVVITDATATPLRLRDSGTAR
jgi:hypothetical protein